MRKAATGTFKGKRHETKHGAAKHKAGAAWLQLLDH